MTIGLRITHVNDTLVLQGRHDTQHYDIQHNDTQYKDTQHKGLIGDIEHNATQHNETLPFC